MSRIKAILKKNQIEELKKKLIDLKKSITKTQAREIGDKMVAKMKEKIDRGSSPIEGWGRFEAYRGQYRERIKKGKLGDKQLTPVNLKLDGTFIDSLSSLNPVEGDSGYNPVIGFDLSKDRNAETKELGHREGANNQAKRPIIPESGERLTQDIVNESQELLKKIVENNAENKLR